MTIKLDPVVFKLGAALYISQIFEHSLILLHMLIDQEQKANGAAPQIGANYSKKTLGNLLNLLKRRIDVPQNALDYIFEAINLRNEIVHGYLTSPENIAKFESDEGISSLAQDLDWKLNEIRARDHLVCGLVDQYLENYGTSTARLKELAEKRSTLFEADEET